MKRQKRWLAGSLSSQWFAGAPFLLLWASCAPEPLVDSPASDSSSAHEQSACAHPICSTGAKLVKSCDPCAAKICATDSYCCNTKWSSLCVREVATICGESCSGTPDMSSPPPDLSGHPPDLSGPAPDLSGRPDGGAGSVGPGGGSVDHLYFAVIGDTRPSNLDDTANYPTAIIQKIYADIEGMSPRPQFVVATGDYMYAKSTGTTGAPQLSLYQHAQQQYTGTVFAAMGNHECDGYTADNCTAPTNNFNAYMNAMVKPLGKTLPYYSVPINATDGSFTAKVLILACNYWSTTQKSWLASELATPTTYTFLVRHEPASATTGPCVSDVETLMRSHSYNLSIVGHTHTYRASGKEVIVGTGGAPLSSGTYGYATVEQTTSGFRLTEYDYATAAAISTTTVPF